jgi:hypothetical protein
MFPGAPRRTVSRCRRPELEERMERRRPSILVLDD